MPSLAQRYTKDLHDNLDFLATWPLGATAQLGDIGTIGGGSEFLRVGSLGHFGVRFGTIAGGGSKSLEYASSSGIRFEPKAAGETSKLAPNIPAASAGVSVRFDRENAIAFRADNLTYRLIDDHASLREEVINLIRANRWDRDWSIVTHVATAEATSALISRSAKSAVELEAHGKVSGAGIDLLSAGAKLTTVGAQDMELSVGGLPNSVPLFRAVKVRRRFFLFGKQELRSAFDDKMLTAAQQTEESPEDFFEPTDPGPDDRG